MTETRSKSRSSKNLPGEFIRLLGENEVGLRAYVLALVPHWADADEIVQQTRIRVWEQWDDYDPSKDFGAWLRTIAYYQVLAFREKSSRSPVLRGPEFFQAVSKEASQAMSSSSRFTQALSRCLKKLQEARRRLLMRYYSGSATMGDIAEEFGVTPEVVKSRIYRSRVALARCVENVLGQEGL